MKQMLLVSLVLGSAVTVFAQEKKNADVVKHETTKVTTTTKTTKVEKSFDLLGSETFNIQDATTFTEGAVDLRFSVRWIQNKNPGNAYYGTGSLAGRKHPVTDDQVILTPEIVWGATERYEMALSVPFWVDGDPNEGNYDSYVGGQWRITELNETLGDVALAWNVRVPTGEGSNGMDATLKGIYTHDWENGMRSHINIWGSSVNTDNYPDSRDIQYGYSMGMDGPLCADGAVRWVFDTMYSSSRQEGVEPTMVNYNYVPRNDVQGEHVNMAELGFQWQINECNKLGFAVQAGLDHAQNETPDVAASFTYAYTLAN